MKYLSRVPAAPLDGWIDDIYVLSGVPKHRRMSVPPMPSAHPMINLAEPVRLFDSESSAAPMLLTRGWFMGAWSKRFVIEHAVSARASVHHSNGEHARSVHLVGVHFKPWGVSPFVRVPLTELRDRAVAADALWGRAFDRLHDRMAAARTPGETFAIIEAELLARVPVTQPSGLSLVTHTARQLEASWGALPIRALSDDAGVTANRLAAQFAAHVGFTPKRVARIYRFARVLLEVDALRPVDWAEMAHRAGYFDQAHFIKEFKAFTGHTPGAYLALRRRHPAERQFPPDHGPMPVE